MIDRVEQRKKLCRFVALTECGETITDQAAACVYCPPFSRTPGG